MFEGIRYLMKKKDGFTLIELLIAITILGLVSAAQITLFKTQMDSASFAEDIQNRNLLASELRDFFADPDNCTKSFENQIVPSGAGESLRLPPQLFVSECRRYTGLSGEC